MKYVFIALKWIVLFLYRLLGIEALVELVLFRVRAYRIRLNIVPTFYKLFLVLIGAVIGVSWFYGASEYKNVMAGQTMAFENVPIGVATVQAEEKDESYDLVSLIMKRESTSGKNNYSKCEAVGKYNRYGYGIPGNGKYLCFEYGEDTKAVAGWIADKRARGLTDTELLCLYNTGNSSESCEYAGEVLALQ